MVGLRVRSLVDVGAGPISHPPSRGRPNVPVCSPSCLPCRHTSLREFIARLGVDMPVDAACPAIVFGFLLVAAPPQDRPAGRRAAAGVGMMWYDGGQGQRRPDADVDTLHLARIDSFSSWLPARGHSVRLLVGEATDEQEPARLSAPADPARDLVSADADLTAGPIHSLQERVRGIARTDIVVASRNHSVICALKLGRATISAKRRRSRTSLGRRTVTCRRRWRADKMRDEPRAVLTHAVG